MKALLRLLVSLGVAALLLTLLLLLGDVSAVEAFGAVRRLPPGVYFLALGLHLFTYSLRALRFRALLPRSLRPGFRRSLVVAAAHNLAAYVLPAKTGEASLVVYLRMQCGVPSSHGLASLLVARFLDGATLCTALAVACLWLESSGLRPGLTWLVPVSSSLVAGTVVFVVLSMRGDLLVRAIESGLRLLRLHRWALGERLLASTNGLALALRSTGDAGGLAVSALLSLPLWCSIFGFFTILVRSMGMPPSISVPETTLGASMGMLANLLPVNGTAGMGTQELGWVTGFHRFLGVDYDLALSTGIGVHLVQLVNILGMGLLSHAAMGMLRGRSRAEGVET